MQSSRHLRQGLNGELRRRLRRRVRDSVGGRGGFFARGRIREARRPATPRLACSTRTRQRQEISVRGRAKPNLKETHESDCLH
jgi:hypothetical protein